MRLKHSWIAAALATVLLVPAASVLADEHESAGAEADSAVNVLVTFHLGRLEAGKRVDSKSYDLVVISGGAPSSLLSGARVPLPTTAADEDVDGDGRNAVTYVYQNIGFTSRVHAWALSDGRIKVSATIEDSVVVGADKATGSDPPVVETRQLSFNALLHPGKRLEVTRVDGIRDRSGFVEVEAEILD